jgi:hypothetical protein
MLLALASAVFSGLGPLGLATIFYGLRFETFLFVASYDSQGHCGGIRPRLHKFLLPLWKPKVHFYVGFEVLTAVVMKSIIFRNITPCNP